jgi:hypothetical protein
LKKKKQKREKRKKAEKKRKKEETRKKRWGRRSRRGRRRRKQDRRRLATTQYRLKYAIGPAVLLWPSTASLCVRRQLLIVSGNLCPGLHPYAQWRRRERPADQLQSPCVALSHVKMAILQKSKAECKLLSSQYALHQV